MNYELFAAIIGLSVKLFIALDPPGNVGPVATMIKRFDFKTQNRILRREVLIALVTMLIFYFGGSYFMDALDLSQSAVKITGGIVFMFIGISILFKKEEHMERRLDEQEPFIVPIAIPLIAGPASLAILISEFSLETVSKVAALCAIFLAWGVTAIIMLSAPLIAKKIGKTGLKVAEQIIGVICVLVATQTILNGFRLFLKS